LKSEIIATSGFNAVLRGVVHYLKVGNNTNIQDNVIVHSNYKKSPTTI